MTEYDGKTTSDTLPREKFDYNGKGWYLRFDDDDEIQSINEMNDPFISSRQS